MELENWLDRCFKITGKSGSEVQFNCPKCDHASFFFNLSKRIGYCHRASCGFSPSIKDLNRLTRIQYGNIVSEQTPKSTRPERVEIVLPDSDPLVTKENGQICTRYLRASEEVSKRGVSPENQYRFGIRFNGTRVYVPVYSAGKLVNYVGRRAWWKDTELERAGFAKYEYCKGASTQSYLFNWDEVRLYPRITLVENTFNGIWIMESLQGTTNFGSTLSEHQILQIRLSAALSVVLLWDEGADSRASKACEKLKVLGIPASYIRIKNQPDNHSLEQLKEWADLAHQYARQGKPRLDT